MQNNSTVKEVRYDNCWCPYEGIDAQTISQLVALGARWSFRNHKLKMARLEEESKGAKTLK